MGALLHGDQHDVADTYNTTQKCKESYHPEGRTDDGDTLFHLQTRRIAIPDPDGPFVFRVHLMVGIKTATIVLLEVFVLFLGCQSVEGVLKTTYIVIIGTEDILDGRIT